jgi:hypothetical protein
MKSRTENLHDKKNYAYVYFRYPVRSSCELQLMENGQEQTFVLSETQKITSVPPW